MHFIRRSLFLQFYATIIGGLLIVALTLVAFAAIGKFDRRDPLSTRIGPFLDSLLPPPGQPYDMDRSVHRMSEALDADISIFDKDGRLLAHAGRPVPPDVGNDDPKGFHPQNRTFTFDTPNGLKIVARSRIPFGPYRRNVAGMVLLFAAALGLAALPLTRRLTRRLESLKAGMDTWSAGALESRVVIEGDDEIAEVARTFNIAASRIEDLVKAQKNLLANASHELRSPLARLRMAIEMYEDTPGPRLKGEIVRNLSELDELVDELLIASRIQAHRPEAFDDIVDLMALVAEEGADVDAEVSGEPVSLKANGKLIRRMVRNLMQNAARHGAPPISASLSAQPQEIVLSVRDHGQGIPEAERERVFEPFYRPSGSSETSGGWGIGLALVRQIAELHGGSVQYANADGGGAEFVVRLPSQQ